MPMKVSVPNNKPFRYIPVDCREDANPPVILMKRLKPIAASELRDDQFQLSVRGKIKKIRMMSTRTKTTIQQLVGWEGLVDDETGATVVFDSKGSQEDMFDILPADLQSELETVFGNGKYDEAAETRFIEAKNAPDEDLEDDEDAEDESDLVDDSEDDSAIG